MPVELDLIDLAIQAYRSRTPDSVDAFRALSEDQANTVKRILKMTSRPRTAKAEVLTSVDAEQATRPEVPSVPVR